MMEILPIESVEPAMVLDAINASFERAPRTMEWYTWKHLDGPWGASTGWCVVEAGRVVGVRLFVPWRVHAGAEQMLVLRAMDGAVRPEARRRGLFSALIKKEVERHQPSSEPALCIYSTSVPASRDAYRKLGWDVFDVDHHIQISRWKLAAIEESTTLPTLVTPARGDHGQLRTAWSVPALVWRADPRSGHQYAFNRLRHSSSDHGVLTRCVGSGVSRSLLVCESWGQPSEVNTLIAACARHYRTPFVRSIAPIPGARFVRAHGASTISMWAPTDQERLAHPQAWSFSYADLEGTM